jgi:hypothetical protein
MESFAKWSVVVLVIIGAVGSIAAGLKQTDRSEASIGGVLLGLLFNLWILVAVLVWWQP